MRYNKINIFFLIIILLIQSISFVYFMTDNLVSYTVDYERVLMYIALPSCLILLWVELIIVNLFLFLRKNMNKNHFIHILFLLLSCFFIYFNFYQPKNYIDTIYHNNTEIIKSINEHSK